MTALHPSATRTLAAGREQMATRMCFFMIGMVFGAWAPLVPLAKARLGIEEGALGLLLLFIGIGSIVAMPVTGVLTARVGCRKVVLVSGAVIVAVLPSLAVLGDWGTLALALAFFGAGVGTVDVAINLQAVIVERDSGRAMMSGFHGMFSLGGIAGAAGMSGLLWLGVSPLTGAAAFSLIGAALLIASGPGLLPYGDVSGQKTPLFVMPRGTVMLIGLLCLLCFLAEGAVLDWSAVFLHEVHGAGIGFSGLGYAAFAVAMTAGRFGGDKIRTMFGEPRVLFFSGILSALGLLIAIAFPSATAALVGFFLVGAGASNVVPVLFSAAGRTLTMPASLAIAAVSTLGYLGILAGPALIGFVAHATDLRFAFGLLAAAMLYIGLNYRVTQAE